MTADVEISPVAIQHKDLNITTTTPTPVPTVQNPAVRTDRIASMETRSRPSEKAKLADLLNAFKQLDIPVAERINILQMLHKTGKLHAELVVD
jgi:flagellar basal body P-ring protein FlgI